MATPVPPSKPPKKVRLRHMTVTHGPSISTYTFVGHPPFTVQVGSLLVPLRVKLAQVGLDTSFRGKTAAQAREIVHKLEAGKWFKPEPKPKLPDPLAEAMANISRRRGKGLQTDEQFTRKCNPNEWSAILFGVDGKGGRTKEQRTALRIEPEVKAEIAAIKLARAEAEPKKADAAPSALDKALA